MFRNESKISYKQNLSENICALPGFNFGKCCRSLSIKHDMRWFLISVNQIVYQ